MTTGLLSIAFFLIGYFAGKEKGKKEQKANFHKVLGLKPGYKITSIGFERLA